MGIVRRNYSRGYQQVQDRFTTEAGKLFKTERHGGTRKYASWKKCGFVASIKIFNVLLRSIRQLNLESCHKAHLHVGTGGAVEEEAGVDAVTEVDLFDRIVVTAGQAAIFISKNPFRSHDGFQIRITCIHHITGIRRLQAHDGGCIRRCNSVSGNRCGRVRRLQGLPIRFIRRRFFGIFHGGSGDDAVCVILVAVGNTQVSCGGFRVFEISQRRVCRSNIEEPIAIRVVFTEVAEQCHQAVDVRRCGVGGGFGIVGVALRDLPIQRGFTIILMFVFIFGLGHSYLCSFFVVYNTEPLLEM